MSVVKDRTRLSGPRAYSSRYWRTGDYPSVLEESEGICYDEAQWTISEGNPYQLLGKSSRLDIGGDFFTVKWSTSLGSWAQRSHSSGGGRLGYHSTGVLVPTDASPIVGSAVDSLDSAQMRTHIASRAPASLSSTELDAFGARAISRVKPTNPTADLAMSIGEFVSERKFFALPGTSKGPAGEYLNFMFGIQPTLADIQDLREAMRNQEKILAQYARDSGRLVRRRYEPDEVVTVDKTTDTTSGSCKFIGSVFPARHLLMGTLTKVTKTTDKMWFSGAFTYHLPREGLLRTVAELDRLYGVVPGTALAWELMPYSWLLDYKLSIGSALSNIDAFAQDGLVMPYGYVMRTREIVTDYTWTGSYGGSQIAVTATTTSVIKQRRAANPFGFGVLTGSLTARQLSIIAALGLSKLEK